MTKKQLRKNKMETWAELFTSDPDEFAQLCGFSKLSSGGRSRLEQLAAAGYLSPQQYDELRRLGEIAAEPNENFIKPPLNQRIGFRIRLYWQRCREFVQRLLRRHMPAE